MRDFTPTLLLAALLAVPAAPAAAQGFVQTQADDYTRYELQAPGSGAFRIFYDVTATTAGAPYYFNTIRAGAEEVVHGVTDLATGEALAWEVVDGPGARASGHLRAGEDAHYIRVTLARPVPRGGETRIRIDKTYVDRASYFQEGDEVVFDRSLGIRRNAVVLPAEFELVSVSHPSQVGREEDGRIRVSFMNGGGGAAGYVVRGRRLDAGAAARLAAPSPEPGPTSPTASAPPAAAAGSEGARLDYHAPERARSDREIVYFLQDPATSSFGLYHDFTEDRPGTDRYLNVVRPGSRVSDPGATLLDTGERLPVETLRGADVAEAGLLPPDEVSEATEVVVVRFPAVPRGGTRRIRIEETYTDPARYQALGDELVWDRSLGRARNVVVLPAGWMLTGLSVPGTVSLDEEGRVRLELWNDRPDALAVHVRGRRR